MDGNEEVLNRINSIGSIDEGRSFEDPLQSFKEGLDPNGALEFRSQSEGDLRQIERLDSAYRSDPKLQNSTRLQEIYQMKQHDSTYMDEGSKHENRFGLKSIRSAIAKFFGFKKKNDAISQYDRIAQSKDNEEREFELHHAMGTALASEGQRVMEINVAGSGFKYFRNEHKGFKGKSYAKDMVHFRQVYGEKVGKFKKRGIYVKKKKINGQEIKRYTIPGPHGLDIGSFNTNTICKRVVDFGKEYFRSVFRSSEWRKNPATAFLNTQAHSRGAVATNIGVKRLAEWLKTTQGDGAYEGSINSISMDAVPGADNMFGEKVAIDFRDVKEIVNNTTMVSIYTRHNILQFTPQLIRGQRRIIISGDDHSMAMEEGDGSQIDANGEMKLHRRAYFDPKTKKAYRGSGVSQMPDAVYMKGENGELVRMRSYAQAYKIHMEVRNGAFTQKGRMNAINTMVKNWFIDNEYVDETETEEEYNQEKERVDGVISKLMESKKDSDVMTHVKDSVRDILEARDNPALSRKERETLYNTCIEYCKIYMSKRDPGSKSGQERLCAVSDILSQMRAEKKRVLRRGQRRN